MRFIFEDRFILEEGVYRAYTTDEKMNIDQKVSSDLRFIFEDRFILEEGVYRAYTTDEKMNIYQKETQYIMKYISNPVRIGNLILGGGAPIVVQTMCNTHTSDVEASFCQCAKLAEAGAQMIRLTVPSLAQVNSIAEIRSRLRSNGIDVPIVADVHFSSEIAIAAAAVVDKVRINPGNFHRDHNKAREQFSKLVAVCKEHGTALRVGVNHG